MTKKEIVIQIADEIDAKQVDVKVVVQKTFDKIVEALAKGQTVELRNFGIFKVKSRKGRMGRNPRTGENIPVPEKKVVSFKPGLEMKARVK